MSWPMVSTRTAPLSFEEYLTHDDGTNNHDDTEEERSPQNMAAGLYRETQSVLDFSQLQSLFFDEVGHRIEGLYSVLNATFRIETTTDLPINEITGLKYACQ